MPFLGGFFFGEQSKRFLGWFLLALIIVLGSWLRMRDLTHEPTWWDEHVSVFAASGMLVKQGNRLQGRVALCDETEAPRVAAFFPEGEIVEADQLASSVRFSNIPAATLFWDRGNGLAFAMLLHVWTKLFGFSDESLRALPCLLGILAIPAIYAVAGALFANRWVALVAALLVSSNDLLIQSSQQTRPYALAVLGSLLATWSWVRGWDTYGRRRLALACIYAAMLSLVWFSHYLAAPVLVFAHLAAGLAGDNRKQSLTVWLAANSLALVAVACWMLWGARLGLVAMGEHDRVWLGRALAGTISWLEPFSWEVAARRFIETTVGNVMPSIVLGPGKEAIEFALQAAMFTSFIGGLWVLAQKGGRPAGAALVLTGILSCGSGFAILLAWESSHTLPFIDRYQVFYVGYRCITLSAAACAAVASGRRVLSILGAAFLILMLFQVGRVNWRAISKEKSEDVAFSMDKFLADATQKKYSSGARLLECKTLDTALIAALKISCPAPTVKIIFNRLATKEISLVSKPTFVPSRSTAKENHNHEF